MDGHKHPLEDKRVSDLEVDEERIRIMIKMTTTTTKKAIATNRKSHYAGFHSLAPLAKTFPAFEASTSTPIRSAWLTSHSLMRRPTKLI